jgi:tRNA (guanine-N7-)-methyltransferase
MRRKKHLTSRMEACEGYIYTPSLPDNRDIREAVAEKEYLNLKEWFGSEKPLWLEIGCGLGTFAVETAKRNPDVNILAEEKVANVIVAAGEKAAALELPNLRFLSVTAEYLPRYLQEKSVSRLFLNFSCPYPKKRYASHRLTAPRFLGMYKILLKDGAEIHQKTDNRPFFEYSIEQFSQCGYTLKNVSLDLHNSDFEGNIVTEYEKRFSDLGQPIYRLEAYLK